MPYQSAPSPARRSPPREARRVARRARSRAA
eukprot:CAMPEP_0185350814 /NCGR_PEP_ID=MMETSP1364-20130426/3069_1 /TAXON_ID=38817 /ORGANISM="Gephyrocapsa oceanica, Strain RCC1303" /LENGTH=30 /DNA_ID= /DNA_START= /DNA_END= /DNA_ORIENTATION=